MTGVAADADDLVQEAFVRAVEAPASLDGGDLERWLVRVATNLSIDSLRRRGTRDKNRDQFSEVTSPFAPSADPDEQSFRDSLHVALAELPADQRAVVHLKLWEGLTFERIAELLDVAPNTAASRFRYGIDKLRHLLRPLYEEIK